MRTSEYLKTGTLTPREVLDLLIDGSEPTETGCWWWTGQQVKGYGVMSPGVNFGESCFWAAHRLAASYIYGDIPKGLVVDHQCHQRRCCNPNHMKIVTPSQNSKNYSGGRAMAVLPGVIARLQESL